MAIGQVRETTDHSGKRAFAVDAVYHPWVLRCSLEEKRFLQQARASLHLDFVWDGYRHGRRRWSVEAIQAATLLQYFALLPNLDAMHRVSTDPCVWMSMATQVGDLAVRFTANDHPGLCLHLKWKQLKVTGKRYHTVQLFVLQLPSHETQGG